MKPRELEWGLAVGFVVGVMSVCVFYSFLTWVTR